MLHTCASISVNISSRSIAVHGRHFDVVGSVRIQVLQDDAVLVSWHGRLQKQNRHEGKALDEQTTACFTTNKKASVESSGVLNMLTYSSMGSPVVGA